MPLIKRNYIALMQYQVNIFVHNSYKFDKEGKINVTQYGTSGSRYKREGEGEGRYGALLGQEAAHAAPCFRELP